MKGSDTMTEDDTFNRLRQRPFNEVTAYLRNNPLPIPSLQQYLKDSGWTLEDYYLKALKTPRRRI